MITASELRIGNWVEFQAASGAWYPRSFEITDYRDFEDEITSYRAVPITEEILLKCGFEVLETSSCKEFHIGINEVTKDWLFSVVWLIKPELINAPNTPFYRNGGHHIAYVHQLQNLYFSLTGQELTYSP